MARSTPFRYLPLILCLGAANLPAQEPGMILPPIPSVLAPDPPDPETLPPPPELEWAPLGPKGQEDEGGTSVTVYVPPPEPEAFVVPPPPPAMADSEPAAPDPAEMELAEPDIEIWRPEGESPQVPMRSSNRLDNAYVTGTEPVWLRVQFDPLAAGKIVFLKPGRGITLQPPEAVLTIPPSGECLVLATLAPGLARSHVIFYCEGVKTVLPVVRASLETVMAAEEGTGGSTQTAAAPLRDPNVDPEGTAGALRSQIQTGGSYNAYSGGGSRIVKDLSVPDALGTYGLDFTRYWNSVHNDYEDDDADWSTDFGHSGWSHAWHWNAIYTGEVIQPEPGPGEVLYKMAITITFPDGHTTKYKIIRSNFPPGNPHLGPPYTEPEITMSWPEGGMGVHDHLTKMAVNGSEFWLSRADGGSVHFVWISPPGVNHGFYRATEVFDRHGLRTELRYNSHGELYQVVQDGGRLLTITWSTSKPGNFRVITKVETGGNAGFQRVRYNYTWSGLHLVLATVTYENDPAPGQTTQAAYTYGTCFGEGTESSSPPAASSFPLLKRADDPRYGGPMTKIRYNYRGAGCTLPEPTPPWQPPLYVPAQPYAIAAEKSDANEVVSSFQLDCESGERVEQNGLGGSRKFYFGSSAGTLEQTTPLLGCQGFQLGKVTDFTTAPLWIGAPIPPGLPNRRQNFDNSGGPRHIWDGRGTKSKTVYQDASGSPSQVVNLVDGSSSTYDRVDRGNSADLDLNRMHNPYTHWLFSKKDENNNVTVYRRDERRRVTNIYYRDAWNNLVASEAYTYNNMNQVTSHTLPSSSQQNPAVVSYEYNTLHQLVRESNNINEEQKEYKYDGLGRVWKMRDTRAIADNAEYTEKMEYNGRHLITKIHYRPTGGSGDPTVTYEYDKYGNRTAIINELGDRKDFTYDAYRRCTSSTEQINPGPGCGNVQVRRWDWIYDREVDGVGMRPDSSHTSSEWRIQVEPVFNGDGHRRATARTFDVNNRILSERTGLIQLPTQPLGHNLQSVAETGTSRFTYDENGQKKTYKDPHNRVTTYGYDLRNRLETTTEPERQNQPAPVTVFTYDLAGNKTKVTFPDLKTQEWLDFDPFGQPRQFKDERGNVTDFNYWPWGPMNKLAEVITHREKDGGGPLEDQHTQFFYDLMGRPETTIFPDGSREISTYQLGQLVEFKTRKGQKKIIDLYDARGREKHHYWRTFEGNVDGTTPAVSRVWDDANRLSSISNIFSTIAYTYDGAGQVRTESTTVAGEGVARTVGYCRYPSGDVAQISYPNGTGITRFYTSRGQLKDVGWGAGATSYVYYPDGTVNYQARTNGVTTSYGYDGRGMIGWLRHSKDGYDLAKRDYWRDKRDRIEAWKRGYDQTYNLMENGRGNRYEYDWEGQLTQASYRAENPEGNATEPYRNDIFQYDKMGNRMGSNYLASRGATTFTRDVNGLNQYSAWTPSVINHDDDLEGWGVGGRANGVVMQEGWITGSYNALNQPVGVTTSAWNGSGNWMWFGYDPLGRCVKRWVGPHAGIPPNQLPPANSHPATYYYYDGWNLIQEGLSGGTPDRVYVHGGRTDEIVASWADGDWSQHQYDAQGNCILLTDTDGLIREQYDYDAFGFPYVYDRWGNYIGGLPGRNRFLFTGREWIKELRLYDYRARLYQPELGRFLQPDPSGFSGGDYNLYRYCDNDPVNKSDPTGLISLLHQGGGDWDFFNGRVALEQLDQQAQTLAKSDARDVPGGVGEKTSNSNAPKGPDEAAIQKQRRILAKQTREGEDSTSAIVDGKPVPGDRARGQQVPYRFGKPVYAKSGIQGRAFRKILRMEEPLPLGRSDTLGHHHTRTGVTSMGVSLAEPTALDMQALKTTGAMLFSNPYLKAEGAYRIYRYGVPEYVTRHDLYDP